MEIWGFCLNSEELMCLKTYQFIFTFPSQLMMDIIPTYSPYIASVAQTLQLSGQASFLECWMLDLRVVPHPARRAPVLLLKLRQ